MLRKPPSLPRPRTLAKKHRAPTKPKGPIAVPAFDTKLGSVEAHEYDPETGRLTVIFRGGRRYHYTDVPAEIAAGMADTPSRGSYLHSNILGKFPHTRADDKPD